MRKLLPLVLPAAALALSAVAHADPGLYVGAGITKAKVGNVFGSGLDSDNTSWKAIVGFKPPVLPLGVEAEYLDFGSDSRVFAGPGTGIGVHSEGKAFAGFAVGYLPIPLPIVGFYGKAGLARWDLSGNTTRPALFSISNHGTQFAWGLGGNARFKRWTGRLEYERFNISSSDGANVYTLGLTYDLL